MDFVTSNIDSLAPRVETPSASTEIASTHKYEDIASKQMVGIFDVSIGEVNAPHTPVSIRRIPPRVDTAVTVNVLGTVPAGACTLAFEGSGSTNGTATINGATTHSLSGTTTVQPRGGNQTSPGSARNLRLVARLGATRIAQSNHFSVAAYPVAIGFLFNRIIQNEAAAFTGSTDRYWGAAYDVTVTSDSGVTADCDQTSISERSF